MLGPDSAPYLVLNELRSERIARSPDGGFAAFTLSDGTSGVVELLSGEVVYDV